MENRRRPDVPNWIIPQNLDKLYSTFRLYIDIAIEILTEKRVESRLLQTIRTTIFGGQYKQRYNKQVDVYYFNFILLYTHDRVAIRIARYSHGTRRTTRYKIDNQKQGFVFSIFG